MPLPRAFASSLLGVATLLGAPLAVAQSVVVAGHARLHVPSTFTVLDEPLQGAQTGGESRPIEQRLVVLSSRDRHPRATLILGATGGGGRYQWHGSCEGMKSDAKRFVHHPFHVNREECVSIGGPYDLDGSIDSFGPGARARLESVGLTMPQGGYIAHAIYALESGQMLEATAFLPLPFAGLTGAPPPDARGSGLPPALIAWSLSFGEQVRKAMQSVSGEWQLPPLE